ncbi:MAG TPA: hypothetical protein VHW01_00520 [Polyangiaceae bacterium]|nr:hypothetical protein [Polyangiaceae bacterium]
MPKLGARSAEPEADQRATHSRVSVTECHRAAAGTAIGFRDQRQSKRGALARLLPVIELKGDSMMLAKARQKRVRSAARWAPLFTATAFLVGCSTSTPSPGGGGSSGCVETELCQTNAHWDPIACECLPDAPDGGSAGEGGTSGATATGGASGGSFCSGDSDCQGPLPQICQVCSDGTTGCAHNECVAGKCEVSICPSSLLTPPLLPQ